MVSADRLELTKPLLHTQKRMEPMVGIEPTTYGLRNRCSTTELHWPPNRGRKFSHLYTMARVLSACGGKKKPRGSRAAQSAVTSLALNDVGAFVREQRPTQRGFLGAARAFRLRTFRGGSFRAFRGLGLVTGLCLIASLAIARESGRNGQRQYNCQCE